MAVPIEPTEGLIPWLDGKAAAAGQKHWSPWWDRNRTGSGLAKCHSWASALHLASASLLSHGNTMFLLPKNHVGAFSHC